MYFHVDSTWTSTGGQSHVDGYGHPQGVSLTWTHMDIHRGSVSRGRMWTSTGCQSHVDGCGHPQGVSLTWTHVDIHRGSVSRGRIWTEGGLITNPHTQMLSKCNGYIR